MGRAARRAPAAHRACLAALRAGGTAKRKESWAKKRKRNLLIQAGSAVRPLRGLMYGSQPTVVRRKSALPPPLAVHMVRSALRASLTYTLPV